MGYHSSRNKLSLLAVARRKPRNPSKRKAPKKDPYKRILIVCEGSKTEPFYFEEIRRRYKLSAANVRVANKGSAPVSVVTSAIRLQDKERRLGERFDEVFCVFDRDEHPTFNRACEKAEAKKLNLVVSWPCFEFWLLLHFGYSRKPYARTGNRSPADECLRDLKNHLSDYEKAQKGLFLKLEGCLEAAKTHAQRTIVDAKKTNDPNPSTEIHYLVGFMQNLKSGKS